MCEIDIPNAKRQWRRSVVKYGGLVGQSGQAIKLFQTPLDVKLAVLSNSRFEWKNVTF